MDRAYIEAAIGNLDAEVPTDDARVMIHLYGGTPDECSMVANETGYLRLGIEMLKAAYLPAGLGNQPAAIPVDLSYLMTKDSEVHIDWFQRREPTPPPVANRWTWADFAAIAFGLLMISMAIIGFITTVNWIGARFASH